MLSIKIGVTQSSISDWEADRKMPPSKTILKLADVLDISTDELFERPISKTSPCSSPISKLCAAYNLNDTARAMIETIISMPPAERKVIAGLARRFSSALDHEHDDNELFNRSAEQLDSEKEAESKTNNTRCSFSIRVKNLRERDGYTQSSLAKVLHVSQSTIGSWETQVREPTLKGISDLCSIFNTSADYLLGLTSNPSVPVSVPPSDFSLVSQLCTTYNLSDKARTMIETIIAMPPNKCEIIAEFAQQCTALLDRNTPEDENKSFRRAADQLASDKENDGITKARA